MKGRREPAVMFAVLLVALAAPFLFPGFRVQLGFFWVMVVFAVTWDWIGGRMGYNSFGNIVFFGIGMYACAVVQIGLFYDVARYTGSAGSAVAPLDGRQFLEGLALGMAVSAVLAVAVAATLGAAILGLRGHYFAIGTLGLGIAAGELANGWSFVGAGSGMVPAMFPDALGSRSLFFYFVFLAIAVAAFLTSKWLGGTRFGLALNAIRDDEDKAEAMGLHTTRYKTIAWCLSAFFLGLIGGGVGIVLGFIDPTETAFAGATYGVWMVLMAILGGKGTLWGPVIGAFVFYLTQELFWTYLLGWQRVALGVLIVVIVVFFPTGILGWARERWPERFGHRIEAGTEEERAGNAPEEAL